MMDHLDDGELQALLDGELGNADEARRHLTACAACSEGYRRAEEASSSLAAALSLLDTAPPRGAAPRATARRSLLSRMPAALPRAALVLLTVGAAASATVPGSPIRAWLSTTFDSSQRAVAYDDRAMAPEAMTTLTSEMAESGVVVDVSGGDFTVAISGAPAGLRIRALLVDENGGGVFVSGDAERPHFRTAEGRIEIDGIAGGEVRVEIPRSTGSAHVEVDGTRYLEKQGDQLRLLVGSGQGPAVDLRFEVLSR